MKKYAIYGGSFNPFGNNHKDIIRWLLEEGGFDKVYVIPSAAHATKGDLPDYMHRLNMTKLGARDLVHGIPSLPKNKEIIVLDVEMYMTMNQPPPIYTWDLLQELEKNYIKTFSKDEPKPEIHFAIGPDIVKEIDNWKYGKEVKENYGIVEVPLFGVRATDLRKMINEQPFQMWKRHVPLSVGGYIRNHNLYQKKQFAYDYPLPGVAVDMGIFATNYKKNSLDILLIRRRAHSKSNASWALPGGFVEVGNGYGPGEQGESLDDAAKRELKEETNIDPQDTFLEQLYTFGEPGRDPRGRVISVAYYSLVSGNIKDKVIAGDDAKQAKWFSIEDLPELDFDHDQVVQKAIERIRGKIDYDPRITKGLLEEKFTTFEFQKVHEIVKGTTYDRSNFRKRLKRMIEDGLIEETNETKLSNGKEVSSYTFKG